MGAIGITYEQAGGGIAGLGIINSEGNNLTLVDRVEHNTVAGISTIEISSVNSKELNIEFNKFFINDNDINYIVSGDNDKINQLSEWLIRTDLIPENNQLIIVKNWNGLVYIPEINFNDLDLSSNKVCSSDMIIANPNCSTIQLVIAISEIHKKFKIKRMR